MRRTAAVTAIAVLALLVGAGTAIAYHYYSDVPDDHTHASGIEWASNQKLVQGHPDGTFRPDHAVTRGQLATVLERQHAWRGPVYSLSPGCGNVTMTVVDHNRVGSGEATVEYAVDGGTRQKLPGGVPPDGYLSFVAADTGLVTLFVDDIAWASTPTGESCVPQG